MKSSSHPALVKTSLLIVPLGICLLAGATTEARDKSRLSPGPVRPGTLDYRVESARGYLTVYSDTDTVNDWGMTYNVHSPYLILSSDGKLFKKVENHYSLSDELPQVVAMPAGSYLIIGRMENRGYQRIPVVVKAGQRITLNPDSRETRRGTRGDASARKNVVQSGQPIHESL